MHRKEQEEGPHRHILNLSVSFSKVPTLMRECRHWNWSFKKVSKTSATPFFVKNARYLLSVFQIQIRQVKNWIIEFQNLKLPANLECYLKHAARKELLSEVTKWRSTKKTPSSWETLPMVWGVLPLELRAFILRTMVERHAFGLPAKMGLGIFERRNFVLFITGMICDRT